MPSNNMKNKSVFISVNFIQTDIQTCNAIVFDYPNLICVVVYYERNKNVLLLSQTYDQLKTVINTHFHNSVSVLC